MAEKITSDELDKELSLPFQQSVDTPVVETVVELLPDEQPIPDAPPDPEPPTPPPQPPPLEPPSYKPVSPIIRDNWDFGVNPSDLISKKEIIGKYPPRMFDLNYKENKYKIYNEYKKYL